MKNYTLNYCEEKFTIIPVYTQYANNNALAIVLYDKNKKEEFDVLTTNLASSNQLKNDEAYIDLSQNWKINFIKENKLAKKLNLTCVYGFKKYQAYKFDLNKLN